MAFLYEGSPSYRYKKLSPRKNGPYKFYTENNSKYLVTMFKSSFKYQIVMYYK